MYNENDGLTNHSFASQITVSHETLFGVTDLYSRNMQEHGHEACDTYPNNIFFTAKLG